MGLLTLTTAAQRSTLFHKMSQTKEVRTEVMGLDGFHSLMVWEGLELWASKQKVFLRLAQTTTGGCEFSGVGSKGSDLPVTSLFRVVFQ